MVRKLPWFCLLIIFLFPVLVYAQTSLSGDANKDGKVDGLDYVIWLNNFSTSTTKGTSVGDFNSDGKVDGLDYVIWLNNFGSIAAPTSTPTSATPGPTAPPSQTTEWTQFGANAQHTNYISQTVTTPWKFMWEWNGAESDGYGPKNPSWTHLSVPSQVQPITGGNRVYIIANNSVYSLDKNSTDKNNGTVLWNTSGLGSLTATPAYENEILYVPSSSGVYKLNAATGAIMATYTQGTSTLAITLAGNNLFIVTPSGGLQSINKSTLVKNWEYTGGSAGSTPVSYYPGNGTIPALLVFVTQDLNVHAVNANTGVLIWKRKPTTRSYESGTPDSNGAQAERGWPVIATQHGIVFVRYRLDWNTIWTWSPFPTTNSAIRTDLTGSPGQQTLFALNLADGSSAFVPAVGNGGGGDNGTLSMGPQPIVRVTPDGKEVAYITWRNGLSCAAIACDGRWDATLGEMVLDNNSVSGYSAGDVRFVKFFQLITDEMMNLTMSGDTIFHSHWLINMAATITNRSAGVGDTFTNPIQTTIDPGVIWRQCDGQNTCDYPGCTSNTSCPSTCTFNASTRYCSGAGSAVLYSYGDSRSYGSGFYEYINDENEGSSPYTVVSAGLVLVKTNDGAIIALANGNPTADVLTKPALAQSQSQSPSVLGTNQTISQITGPEAFKFIDQFVTVNGTIITAVNHLPKAVYLWFGLPEKSFLIRVFNSDISKFTYDPMSLKGKKVAVTGKVTLFFPEGTSPEIIVTDPSQIQILK